MNEVANSNANESRDTAALELAVPLREGVAKFRIGDTVRRWCFQSLGDCLSAVILTGSLSRNEATWQETEHGLRFLSDAEFIVIVKSRHEVPAPGLVTLICSGAEEELRNRGVLCKLSIGAVHESFLLNLGQTIFGHELLTCGEVLYGDPDILLNQASRAVPEVSKEDAWRLLANRTIELLELAPELTGGAPDLSDAAQYRLTKLYCDMATSILVFKREFVAGYQARCEKLTRIHESGLLLDLPLNVDWFVAMVQRCTEYKILHSWNGPSPFQGQEALMQAIAALRSLWSWELAQISGAVTSTPISMLRLHMREQPWRERMRGWAFVVRRFGVLNSLRYCWRWLRLGRCASPRYGVYAAGLEAVALFERELPRASDKDATQGRISEMVTNWLPVPNPFGRSMFTMKEVAEAVLWNYQEFLVETRA